MRYGAPQQATSLGQFSPVFRNCWLIETRARRNTRPTLIYSEPSSDSASNQRLSCGFGRTCRPRFFSVGSTRFPAGGPCAGVNTGGPSCDASPGTGIACHHSEMRGSVLLAAGVLVLSTAAAAQDPPRVLEVTLADLDEDSLDFLIGWERWKSDILDLASEGYARFTLAPLLAVEPGLPLNARFSGRIFEVSGQRAAHRPIQTSRPPRRPVRTARAPRDGASDRGRLRPPRGLAPIGRLPRPASPKPRSAGRGPKGFGATARRSGSRGGAAGASTGRAPTGRAKPRGSSPRPRGPAAVSRGGNERTGNPRPHR